MPNALPYLKMKQLPLDAEHRSLGAKMGDFAGYQMPLYYSQPLAEHHAVRNQAGLFDISHMGQFCLHGSSATEFLQYALTNDVRSITDGQALYSPMCQADGGVLDDLIVYRQNSEYWRVIVNGANREKDFQWLKTLAEQYQVKLQDISPTKCLLAAQGPLVLEKLSPHTTPSPTQLAYYSWMEATLFECPVFIARTGYTGEPGVEISVSLANAPMLWRKLTQQLKILPIGLIARDTLRLEAAMSLYGHELLEKWHPLECALGWAVKLNTEDDFIGKKVLSQHRQQNTHDRLIALELTDKGIPRQHCSIFYQGQKVGIITSGSHSPTSSKSIALAKVKKEAAKQGTPLTVEIRGRGVEAMVVKKPFYQNPAVRN